jgi:amidophosphoribosyltransferase
MCGLVGVWGSADAASHALAGLLNLQHRGQDGAGMLSFSRHEPDHFALLKSSGLVENIFSDLSLKNLRGDVVIGHTRYATVGHQDPNLLQPFLNHEVGVGLAHNGNIVNFYDLSEELLKQNAVEQPFYSDSELILHLLAKGLSKRAKGDKVLEADHYFESIKECMEQLVGGYAVVGLDKRGQLFGFRDPDGIRPLVVAGMKNGSGPAYVIASESVSLKYLGFEEFTEIAPGEAVIITESGELLRKQLKLKSYSPCMFEWVYFARVESEMGNTSLYQVRFDLGTILAKQLKELGVKADIVVPVPETSRAAAVAISEVLNLPFREVLIKNRYVNRTFILDRQETRALAVKRKLFPVASQLKDKDVLVVDDSIVRGNTAKQIIDLMRQCGAKSITLVSTCPPIRYPCYYGIDFPSHAELVAPGCDEKEIAKKLGADRVIYQSIEGLRKALQQKSLCTGCLDQGYPTDVSCGEDFGTRRQSDRVLASTGGALTT